MRPIVMSIRPKWAALIRSGEKTIELRRRFPCYLSGAVAYLYESSPHCSLSSIVLLGAIQELSIEDLYQMHGRASRIDEQHFYAYFDGRDTGFALEITKHTPMPKTWELFSLRREFNFIPPQSWAYASPKLVTAVRKTI